ncbi:alpha/beta hydrolase [Nonlabens spongiae]|uniref:Alpha/beta hydrolase n=1 Tax=Nonlabens spongiae TaxID=331648 RepID=A0A1W6MLW3_9FLAO|nr:alpha/beta hydrolase [Nonlabens spongiae]ARN78588.1 alpha/beta hydrolase [Nonlabens spongiae]
MKTLLTLGFIILFSFTNQAQAIKATVKGTGDPILLLAGFASTSDVWHPLEDRFAESHELHLVDYAGFGKLPAVEMPFLDKVRNELINYVRTIDDENLVIIGHSMGGTLAAWLGAQPDLKIKQIIIIDGLPATGALMFPNVDLATLTYENPYNDQMMAMDDSAFAKAISPMAAGMAKAFEHQNAIKQDILNTDRKTYVYGYTDYLKFDVREDLKQIDIPVTILGAAGMFGEEMATNTYKNQYENLKEYTFKMHPNSKHFIMYDDPSWLNAQIVEVLKTE